MYGMTVAAFKSKHIPASRSGVGSRMNRCELETYDELERTDRVRDRHEQLIVSPAKPLRALLFHALRDRL